MPTECDERRDRPDAVTPRKRLSMHEGIAVWCDCCSCQAEPYWLEVAEELGMDLGSDYEDEPPTARYRENRRRS